MDYTRKLKISVYLLVNYHNSKSGGLLHGRVGPERNVWVRIKRSLKFKNVYSIDRFRRINRKGM